EASCVLALGDEPVAIKQVELGIVERAFADGLVAAERAAVPSGRRVAIVGSGPAGLAAAQQLGRAGHAVTVFERDDRPGGLLRYGIPDCKMDKALLDRRLAQLVAEGVELRGGADVGAGSTPAELRAAFDAVVLACGAPVHRPLDV